MKADVKKATKLAANYLVTELQKFLIQENQLITEMKISAENFAELITFIADGKINSSAAQIVLQEMFFGDDDDPSHIIETKNLAQVSDSGELTSQIEKVLVENESSVADYQSGKENAIKFLMGQVMKATQGKANPQMVMEILKEKLSK
jgi:aspartyl-tRNA(Asn)/glutamyl-tRNA(Gln) amidotransferase subunit B